MLRSDLHMKDGAVICLSLSVLTSSLLVGVSDCRRSWMFKLIDKPVQCPVTGVAFASVYTSIIKDMDIADHTTGKYCSAPVEDKLVHEGTMFQESLICQVLLNFSRRLLVNLNGTQDCCIRNISSCRNSTSDTDDPIDITQAYGYGTLMVILLSLLSLVGIVVLPLLRENTKLGRYYEHFNLFMISLGTSALFSDAVLHLLPQSFGLDHHTYQVYYQGKKEGGELEILWKACAVLGGMYLFYLFELLLCMFTGYSHSHEANNAGFKRETGWRLKAQPLVVLIICGDAFRNFTDGVALGSSISMSLALGVSRAALHQSLALGITTAVALVFHEIPHELGNFAILLSTGMRWLVVIFFNFLSFIAALVGFFIGASVGIVNNEANTWTLAMAAGTFLYVALVDLVHGCMRIFISNIGFFISFSILLLIHLL